MPSVCDEEHEYFYIFETQIDNLKTSMNICVLSNTFQEFVTTSKYKNLNIFYSFFALNKKENF